MIGRKLQERYLITTELGRGGMGVVYKAHDQLLARPVAIKVINRTGLEDSKERERLILEARATARLDHPHIVTVYDVLEVDGSAFLVMQFVEGDTLVNRQLESLDEIIAASQQICQALEYAHSQGIIHRDVKPANVLISDNNSIMLMDFGLALTVSTQLSMEDAFAGTMDYISPEQITGQRLDGRADLYSFGVMLYELVTGQLPFVANDPVSLLTQHLYSPVVPPITINEVVPFWFNNLIIQLLKKEPDQRSASTADVLVTLEQLADPDLFRLEPDLAPEQSLLDRIFRGRLVSRQKEIGAARAAWVQARAGDGHALLVSGEAGIGKSAFVREIRTFAEATEGRTLVGNCYVEGAAPYAPFVDMVRRVLESTSISSTALSDRVMAELLVLAPELQSQFPDLPTNPPLASEKEKQRLFESIVSLFNQIAREQPLLVIIEDIHWADSGTAALLQHLSRCLTRSPVLIVPTLRDVNSEENPAVYDLLVDLNRERLSTEIKLERLDMNGTEQLLEALFQEPVTPDFLEGICHVTEGNPFFIEEVCKSLVESSSLYYEEGAWHRPDMSQLPIPTTIRAAVDARVKRLTKKTQDALLLGAVIGRAFNFDLLAQASDMDEDDLLDALEGALRAQIIIEERVDGDITLSFAHSLIPTSMLEGVMYLRLRRLHLRVGEAYEELGSIGYGVMAHHFSQAGAVEKALTYLIQAGNHAATAAAHSDAEDHYRAALNLTGDPEQRAKLLSTLGQSLDNLGQFEEALESWKEAIDLFKSLDRLDQVAGLYALSIRAYWDLSQIQRSVEIGLQGLTAAADLVESPELADLLHETARAYAFRGSLQEAASLCQEALTMAIDTGAVSVQANTLITLAFLPGISIEEQISLLNEAISLAQSARLMSIEARALNNRSILYTHYLCDYDNALKDMQRGEALAKQQGDLGGELTYLVGAVWTDLDWGSNNLVGSKERLKRAEELVQAFPLGSDGWVRYQIVASLFFYYSGAWDQAEEQIKYLEQKNSEKEINKLWVRLIYVQGKIFYGRGDYKEAIELLEECQKKSEDDIIRSTYILFVLGTLASAYAKKGDLRKAEETVTQAETILESSGNTCLDTYFIDGAKANLAAAEAHWNDAWSQFEAVDKSFAEFSASTHRAELLLDWGDAHLHRGLKADKDIAQQHFQDAHDLLIEIGAREYAARVESRLANTDSK